MFKHITRRYPLLVSVYSLLITAFFVWTLSTSPPAISAQVVERPAIAANLSEAVKQVAKDNIAAVVHIEVTQRQEVTNPMLPFENDPFFRYFFNAPQMPKKFKRELKGLGTGMIMDAESHILTSNHVVAGATEIQVLLSNGKQYPANAVGTDPKTDLAVIEISADESLPHVTFGDSDKVEVGEWGVAIDHRTEQTGYMQVEVGLGSTIGHGVISMGSF